MTKRDHSVDIIACLLPFSWNRVPCLMISFEARSCAAASCRHGRAPSNQTASSTTADCVQRQNCLHGWQITMSILLHSIPGPCRVYSVQYYDLTLREMFSELSTVALLQQCQLQTPTCMSVSNHVHLEHFGCPHKSKRL